MSNRSGIHLSCGFELSKDELNQSVAMLHQISAEIDQGIFSYSYDRIPAFVPQVDPSSLEWIFRPLSVAPAPAPVPAPPPLPPAAPFHFVDRTNPAHHEGQYVPTLAFLPPWLPLGYPPVSTATSGWLVSASDELLNLWACGQDPQPTPSLVLAKSKKCPYHALALEVLPESRTLASALRSADKQCYVKLLSLDMKTFGDEVASYHLPQGVAQLVSWPGAERLACSSQASIILLDSAQGGLVEMDQWNAHKVPITTLRQPSPFSTDLVSGDVRGNVHMWDIGRQPPTPSVVLRTAHTKAVTGIEMLGQNVMITVGGDAHCYTWDLRNPSTPLGDLSVDGKSILNVKISDHEDLLVISTLQGVYEAQITPDYNLRFTLLPSSNFKASPAIVWNSHLDGRAAGAYSRAFYCSELSGAISTYASLKLK